VVGGGDGAFSAIFLMSAALAVPHASAAMAATPRSCSLFMFFDPVSDSNLFGRVGNGRANDRSRPPAKSGSFRTAALLLSPSLGYHPWLEARVYVSKIEARTELIWKALIIIVIEKARGFATKQASRRVVQYVHFSGERVQIYASKSGGRFSKTR
jgi:hypothetical protein